MGYTHYYYTDLELDKENFEKLVKDFTKVLTKLTWNYKFELCDWEGKGKPEINNSEIAFNGTDKGDLGHESFVLARISPAQHTNRFNQTYEAQKDSKGKYFHFCKTARKPYDIAVMVCLVIAKHHLKDQIRVCSDGDQEWIRAINFCEKYLGYGKDFKLEREIEI